MIKKEVLIEQVSNGYLLTFTDLEGRPGLRYIYKSWLEVFVELGVHFSEDTIAKRNTDKCSGPVDPGCDHRIGRA